MANKYYKSVPPEVALKAVGAKTKAFVRKAHGVSRIVRDTYGSKADWYALCKEVKARDRNCCVFCKKPENPKKGVYHDVHHVVPLSRGGTTTKANLATTCDTCHARRPGHSHMLNHKH